MLDALIERCSFPAADAPVACAFSGGADSTALVALAGRAGLTVTAHHVDHGIRGTSGDEALRAREIAETLGVSFVLHEVNVDPGPNLEARARTTRYAVLPPGSMTGHTADDQAETVLIRLLRGSGSAGLGGIAPGKTHPILSLRRSETEAVCRLLDIRPVHDPSNDMADVWRNRVRAEALPLLTDIAERDLVPILSRSASLLREENAFLDRLAADVDPTDALALQSAHVVIARRALRRWLTESGYPPDGAAVERVMSVVRGEATACELQGGRRIQRSGQRLRVIEP